MTKNFLSLETRACKGFQQVQKNKPGRLWAAGLYKGWVSKHNPYTILKRNFTIKKYLHFFFKKLKRY